MELNVYGEKMSDFSVALANGGNENRRELDFYPTPPEVTQALLDFLEQNNVSFKTVWEPACGNGHMSSVLEKNGYEVTSSDLRFTEYGSGGVDFLNTGNKKCDAIITNPPFNISEQFILKALEYSPIVAMVLKSQYWHAKKRIELFNKTKPKYVLPLTWRPDFLFDQRENGKRAAPTMECVWTVWFSGNTAPCQYIPLLKP